ncbi:MAG: M48 family metallopeptidase [Methanobrevibacter sp.]|uniref:M48 family metallopeptidase n=1 Tax=Methanobrevibacter sp. TaxID=66852 RepID=UPI003F09B57F
MAKEDRSEINPFTGKKHYDTLNDDKFLEECYNEYYSVINQSQLLDNTSNGQLVLDVVVRLINAVNNYLSNIGRLDYVEDYYDWEVHLVGDDTVNAFCMPGGKIVMFSGIFSVANTEERIAFILGHEMAHALLDHSRTRISAQNTQNAVTSAAWIGSFAMDLLGFGGLGDLTRVATNVASIGSQFFLMNPWGRDQELEADRLGMMIIHWAGYDISHIPAFWRDMSRQNSNEHDFFSTHPADSKRIATMEQLIIEIEREEDFYSRPVIGNNSTISTNSPSNFCTNCGAPVGSNDKFCFSCGNKLEVELKCPKCSCRVGDGDAFCTNCGYKL